MFPCGVIGTFRNLFTKMAIFAVSSAEAIGHVNPISGKAMICDHETIGHLDPVVERV